VQQLLDAFGDETPETAAEFGAVVPPPPHLVEPLSDREAEVLALLVTGLTNREIAEELVVTEGTIKWHVHNIYQKLDVSGRAEAIARAHEWRLLP
jgi:ATP/maltotriose-dependent transcriptional regulator MalT